MAAIEQDLQQIRRAVYGRDVREAIADGIEQGYNIAVESSTASSESVKYVAQTITEEQKAQARINIGVPIIQEDDTDNGLVVTI